MSFEFGIFKENYKEDIPWENRVYYFSWCGRENIEIYRALCTLGTPHISYEDGYYKEYVYEIEVSKFDFIPKLYKQVTENEQYNIIMKLCRFHDNFVDEYIDGLTVREMAELRLAFILDDVDEYTNLICIELFDKFEYGYDMVSALYEAYKKIAADGVKTVWLYGG